MAALCEGCRRLIHSGPKASSRYTLATIIAAVPMTAGTIVIASVESATGTASLEAGAAVRLW